MPLLKMCLNLLFKNPESSTLSHSFNICYSDTDLDFSLLFLLLKELAVLAV